MKKLEKEIKVLDINPDEIMQKLDEKGAKKVGDTVQRIFVYDLPSISSRYYDSTKQLSEAKKPHEILVAKAKLLNLSKEIDNLTDVDDRKILLRETGYSTIEEILVNVPDEDLEKVLTRKDVISVVKKQNINPNKWIRLRQTGKKTTITIKHILNGALPQNNYDGFQPVLETEIPVPSIEEGNTLLESLGYAYRNYQEKRRVSYEYKGVEIDIDSWPHIPPYMEIEHDNVQEIDNIITELGLEEHEIVSCNTSDVYTKYGIDIYKYRELRFEDSDTEKTKAKETDER